MATKQITTWEEFKTALTETITENTTYEIMNDIDVSDNIIEAPIIVTGNLTSANQKFTKTFEGQSHKINGITSYYSNTSTNLALFQYTIQYASGSYRAWHDHIFNNLHFSNFMCASCFMFYMTGNGGTGVERCRYTFNQCFFNGICYGLFSSNNDVQGYVYFNSCSFNVKCTKFQSGQLTHNNTYAIMDPLSTNGDWGSSSYYISPIFVANNSYFGGKIAITYNTGNYYYVLGLARTSYVRQNNNVFNFDIVIVNYNSSTTYNLVGSSPGAVSENTGLINRDKFYQSDGVTQIPTTQINDNSGYYLLTDTQLKSKTYIQENTDFPLRG